MRDYAIGRDDDPAIPVAQHTTEFLQEALELIGSGAVPSTFQQCTAEQMMERIRIELRWRALGGTRA